jgi:oxygen-dependent protoporphyrinogen oxidase
MAAVAIIGGGLTGLSAAFSLKQRGSRVVVYEASDRIGGVIRSERRDGYLAELGATSMSAVSPEIGRLLSDLGLDESRITASPVARTRYIVRRGKLVQLPATPAELLTTRLISNSAKLAVFGEPLVERSDSTMDESVAAFVRRRFNQEVLDYVVNPFVAGIFAGDPEQLSVRHALPQLHALERDYGSVMKGFLQVAKRLAPLVSFRNGVQEIIDAFGRQLATELRLRSPVTQVRAGSKGWTVGAAFQAPELYDAVIYTAPAYCLGDVDLDLTGAERLSTLASIVYPPVAVLALGFRREQVAHPLDGFGVLTPEVERRRVLGVIFSSTVFPGRAPEGHVLLTVFAGGVRDPDFVQADPHTLTARVLDELRTLLGVRAEPSFRAVHVWPKAIPQYTMGYGRFKEIAEQAEQANPGFLLAGTYRDGVSLGAAMTSGEQAASRAGKLLGLEPVTGGVSAAGLP